MFIDEALRRYSLTIFACHFCGRHFVTCAIFAEHLVDMHRVEDPILNRFLGRDSDASKATRPNRSSWYAGGPWASS